MLLSQNPSHRFGNRDDLLDGFCLLGFGECGLRVAGQDGKHGHPGLSGGCYRWTSSPYCRTTAAAGVYSPPNITYATIVDVFGRRTRQREDEPNRLDGRRLRGFRESLT